MEENIIHNCMNRVRPYLKKLCGAWYMYLHLCLAVFSTIIFLFDNNVYHLILLLNIIFLDSLSCIILSDCPLNILEEKYTNTSMLIERMKCYNNFGIMYKCDHIFECTMELLINVATLLSIKIVMLIAMQIFSINFHPSTMIYPTIFTDKL